MPQRLRQEELRLILEPPLIDLWEAMRLSTGLPDEKLLTLAASALANHLEALSEGHIIVVLRKGDTPRRLVLPGELSELFKRPGT